MEVKRNLPRRDGGWKGQFLLPLILLSERSDSSVLVMGISPFSCLASNPLEDEMTEEQKRKLLPLINFKQFFKLAAKDMEIKYRCNCKLLIILRLFWLFDSSILFYSF